MQYLTTANGTINPAGDAGTVLYLDQNTTRQRIVAKSLRHMGYEIMSAFSTQQARQLAQQQMPDLILMTVESPDDPALDLAAHLRSLSHTGTVPIVAISADTSTANRRACRRAGIQAFLEEPYSQSRLLKTVQQWMSQSVVQTNF